MSTRLSRKKNQTAARKRVWVMLGYMVSKRSPNSYVRYHFETVSIPEYTNLIDDCVGMIFFDPAFFQQHTSKFQSAHPPQRCWLVHDDSTKPVATRSGANELPVSHPSSRVVVLIHIQVARRVSPLRDLEKRPCPQPLGMYGGHRYHRPFPNSSHPHATLIIVTLEDLLDRAREPPLARN